MNPTLYVFTGYFPSYEEACLYTEPQWELEPTEPVSDSDYTAWEDRNPTWQLRDDLGGVYLDSDFIETISGHERYKYLGTYLVDPTDLIKIKDAAPNSNILLLLFPDAFGGFNATIHSTSKMTYCGMFAFQWP